MTERVDGSNGNPEQTAEGSLSEFIAEHPAEGQAQGSANDAGRRTLSGWSVGGLVALAAVFLVVAYAFGYGMYRPEPSEETQRRYDFSIRPALVDMSAQLRVLGFDAPTEDDIPMDLSSSRGGFASAMGDRFWVNLSPIPVAIDGGQDAQVLEALSSYDADGSLSEVEPGRYTGSMPVFGGATFWSLTVEFNEDTGRSAHITVSTYQASS